MKTEELIKQAVKFYKTSDRMVDITKDDRDLVSLVCHVRHAGESNFGYKSLEERFPEECEFIQEKEKEIYVSGELNKFKNFLKETESEKRAPKINKNELNLFMFLLWCKKEVKEEGYLVKAKSNLDFLFNIEEDMEIITDFTLPKKKVIERMKSEGQEIHNADLIRAEEFQNKVSKYWKLKENLFKYYERFMNCPCEYNYKYNLELRTAMNEYIAVNDEFNNYLNKKIVGEEKTLLENLMKDNFYIKEVIEDEVSRKIIFKGEHYIEEEEERPKKLRKRSKKEEA